MSTGGSGKNLRTTKKQINEQLDTPRNRQLDGGSFIGASVRGSNNGITQLRLSALYLCRIKSFSKTLNVKLLKYH